MIQEKKQLDIKQEGKQRKELEQKRNKPTFKREIINGKVVIHNKLMEKWVPEKGAMPQNMVEIRWQSGLVDDLSEIQYQKLISRYDFIDTPAKYFWNFERKCYVLYKDPILPLIKTYQIEPPCTHRILERCQKVKMLMREDGTVFSVPLTWDEL